MTPFDEDFVGELSRPVLTRINTDGSETAASVTTPLGYKVRAECLVASRLVVPVIFVPGIMGTRLRVAQARTPAWFPPEGTWDGLKQVLQSLGHDASQRQRLLNPKTTEVDDNGPTQLDPESAVLMGDAPGKTVAERSKWRGWGQLHGNSYAQILGVLERRLARILVDGVKAEPHWASGLVRSSDAARLGARKPFVALDDAALRRAAHAFYPVHAVGYNWLQSNLKSADRLAKEIGRIIDYYSDRNKLCEKVIIVTHSMGGLVTRACMQLPGMQERVLGVVHGVMPALGAPATYKRMRAGAEGLASTLIGRDGGEATAVVANAAGPLELLPTRQYRCRDKDGNVRHWLRASHPDIKADGRIGEKSIFFGESDFYQAIYLNNSKLAWWRMVKAELINPRGRATAGEKKLAQGYSNRSDFQAYASTLEEVANLHKAIEDKYHPITYAYYAADAQRLTWNEVNWKCGHKLNTQYSAAETIEDDLVGRVQIQIAGVATAFKIDGPSGHGDGTVPEESGAAPTHYSKQIFCHEGIAKGHDSYEHQFCYSSAVGEATTLYSIVRIVADSDWVAAKMHQL